MLINLLKFLHLLCILGIVGSTLYGIFLIGSKKFVLANTYHQQKIKLLNRVIMWLIVFSIITGTLLIYPKNFTFHTPWIEAAYVLIFIFSGGVGILQVLRKRTLQPQRWLWLLIYTCLTVILVAVTHDAVTKTPVIDFAALMSKHVGHNDVVRV